MENIETNLQTNNSILIDEEVKGYLIETARWTKFFSIVGFVSIGLMVLASIFMILVGSTFNSYSGSGTSPTMLGVIYILCAVLYYFPIKYLYQFSKGVKEGMHSNNQEAFNNGLRNLKSHYKYIGILTIVLISFYVLLIISLVALRLR